MGERYYAPKVDSVSLPTKGPLGNHNVVQNEVFKLSDLPEDLQKQVTEKGSRLSGLLKEVDGAKARKYLHARDTGLSHSDAAEAADDPDYEYEDHDNLDTDDQGKAVHPAADSGSTNPEKVEAEVKETVDPDAAQKQAKADAEAAEAAKKADDAAKAAAAPQAPAPAATPAAAAPTPAPTQAAAPQGQAGK